MGESSQVGDDGGTQNRMVAMGQVSAGVVHEVRNVMTGILGFAQVAQSQPDPARVAELLGLIERESMRCIDILSRFLDFARRVPRTPVPVDLGDVATGVAQLVGHRLSLAQVKLALELDAATPPIAGDPGALTQVLLNLLLNAMQAMPGGGNVRVRVQPDDGGGARVVIADDGHGIPAAVRGRLAEPFVTSKPPGQGTGLGLAVSLGIVREHGGTMTVESEEGHGTTFTLRFPAPGADPGGR
jgi:signal transduction histidine kinase